MTNQDKVDTAQTLGTLLFALFVSLVLAYAIYQNHVIILKPVGFIILTFLMYKLMDNVVMYKRELETIQNNVDAIKTMQKDGRLPNIKKVN